VSAARSRYADSEQLVRREADGRLARYLAARILPQGSTVAQGATVPVAAGEVDRLDLFVYRQLGNAMLAYRVCDANDAIDPLTLCETAGSLLRVPGSTL
jgi:hypothetical protein